MAVNLSTWFVAGLTVFCDWLGSNTDWFQYATAEQHQAAIANYWAKIALPRAEKAVREAQVVPSAVTQWQSIDAFLPKFAQRIPSPAQRVCSELEIANMPQLLLLEDATGAGKTEAALIYAQRLMSAGLADGIYFGLPTQATADQMYERVDNVAERMFKPGEPINVVLAHGQREQNPLFQLRRQLNKEAQDERSTASQQMVAWVAQRGKLALLAQVGVGTIDQSQLTALRVKHQPLRLLGLFGKVLIVDEVHAYDAYMQTVLCSVLFTHAAAGGSVVLLSATLPLSARQKLFAAFDSGCRFLNKADMAPRFGMPVAREKVQSPKSLAYPLLTRYFAGSNQCEEIHIEASPASQRVVKVDYRHKQNEVDDLLVHAQQNARAACWIRNSVIEAVAAYQRLCANPLVNPDRIILFHSRFALCDRLKIQQQVLRHFDSNSNAIARSGWLVIATQVIEQSLDVDFDVMVSDLAPIDSLLQRQGRLHRHRRDSRGNILTSGADQREKPVLVVFGPDRDQVPAANTIRKHSAATSLIYPAHGQLWLSAKVLGEAFNLPADFRCKVEAVYCADANPPECFVRADGSASGDQMADSFAGARNVVQWEAGYHNASDSDWSNDEKIGTRLGTSIEALLLVWDGRALQAWANALDQNESFSQRLERSIIRIPEHWRIVTNEQTHDDLDLAEAIENLRQSVPALRWRFLLPLVDGSAKAINQERKAITITYAPAVGLQMRKTND